MATTTRSSCERERRQWWSARDDSERRPTLLPPSLPTRKIVPTASTTSSAQRALRLPHLSCESSSTFSSGRGQSCARPTTASATFRSVVARALRHRRPEPLVVEHLRGRQLSEARSGEVRVAVTGQEHSGPAREASTHRLRVRPLGLRGPDAFPVDDVNAVVLRGVGRKGCGESLSAACKSRRLSNYRMRKQSKPFDRAGLEGISARVAFC